MIDVIGILYDQPPINSKGEYTSPPQPLDGYHVNSTLLIEELENYQVIPNKPYRLFSGIETYFYVFADEQQAKELIGWNNEDGYTPKFIPVKNAPERIKSSKGLLVLAEITDQDTGKNLFELLQLYMSSDTASVQEKIIYEREPYWYRDDALITGMAEMFNLSSDQVDDLFIQAGAL